MYIGFVSFDLCFLSVVVVVVCVALQATARHDHCIAVVATSGDAQTMPPQRRHYNIATQGDGNDLVYQQTESCSRFVWFICMFVCVSDTVSATTSTVPLCAGHGIAVGVSAALRLSV